MLIIRIGQLVGSKVPFVSALNTYCCVTMSGINSIADRLQRRFATDNQGIVLWGNAVAIEAPLSFGVRI